MTDFFADQPMTPEEIRSPTLYETVEWLREVGVNDDTLMYQKVANDFSFCRPKWFYCRLAIWRDNEWVLFYAKSANWPYDQEPFSGQYEEAYRASKNSHIHEFDLVDGRPVGKRR